MRFQTRNAYYLRISATTVIPLYLYLDERHVDWMSERVLQHVLADLRPLILPKLNAEADAHLGPGGPANAKRGTLDVHRGDTYQFGYFLRGTEPHAVLIKTRTFTAAPKPAPRPAAAPAISVKGGKKTAPPASGKKRKPKPRPRGKGKARARLEDDDDDIDISSGEDDNATVEPAEPLATRRSKRARKVVAGGYAEDVDDDMNGTGEDTTHATNSEQPVTREAAQDGGHPIVTDQLGDGAAVTLKHEEAEPSLADLAPGNGTTEDAVVVDDDEPQKEATMDVELVDEDEEDVKPKPTLKLSYHGFNIHGRCLCVIVEPYPPLRAATRAPSLAPMGLVAPRAPSIAPPDFVPSGGPAQRARTPLFLPDFDREPTPAPAPARNLPPVPLFSGSADTSDDEENGEMVLFSQLLRSVGDHPPGIAEDDDEIDGAVFFGDADEMREL
ncbi:hypothetical protein C8Q77DRAFT_1089428 [Trametes polyzona]|nr:hypothetical protein C8Q77DRAFT_1089428 [Trametes polyzona]